MIQAKPHTKIMHNKKVHDSVAHSYERIHTEIYNPMEQTRITAVCKEAISNIKSTNRIPSILDFGAGTGNLTGHLLELGANVTAADVSIKSLELLKARYGNSERLETAEINGIDLSNMKNCTFDMVATYSVLHHLPDYLGIISEFIRVVKPGGVIYIDHENAPGFWLEHSCDYNSYMNEYRVTYTPSFSRRLLCKIRILFSYNDWRRYLKRKLYGLNSEGDIHVFLHDHIEWNLIDEILAKQCMLLKQDDYLLCRELSPLPPLYSKYKEKCVDMRFEIFKKNE